MIYLIYGASGSGKSAFAEKVLEGLPGEKKYYIATMMANENDADAQKKIERHKKLREGKGFETIERPKDLQGIGGLQGVGGSALLECMSNLCANEMFAVEGGLEKSESQLADKILAGIKSLTSIFENLVIVSNNVFEDGIEYDEATQKYMRLLGNLNCQLAAISDKVYEVIAGIPVEIK